MNDINCTASVEVLITLRECTKRFVIQFYTQQEITWTAASPLTSEANAQHAR